jgi:hypothetical protein
LRGFEADVLDSDMHFLIRSDPKVAISDSPRGRLRRLTS